MRPRVEIKGGGNFQNCWGALILSFIAFLCDNFKNFPNFDLPQGGQKVGTARAQRGVIPPSPPPFGHICLGGRLVGRIGRRI